MANTYRKTTVSPSSVRKSLLSLSGDRPKHNTANILMRQESRGVLLGLIEAEVPRFMEMARTAATLHAQFAGSTVSASTGNVAGRSRFAVSIYPQRAVEVVVAPTWELLFTFAILNADILPLPDHALGTWFDGERNRHVLDVVVHLSSLEEAIRLGIHHGQKAIYDLEAGREMSVGAGFETITTHLGCEEY